MTILFSILFVLYGLLIFALYMLVNKLSKSIFDLNSLFTGKKK